VDKSYKAQNPELVKYLDVIRGMVKYFLGFGDRSFLRALNKGANGLAKAVAQKNPLRLDVFFETLKHGSIHSDKTPVKFVNAITNEDWRATIMAFLQGHFILEDEKKERRMALQARDYTIINEELYRRGVCAPLLKCISRDEGRQLLNGIHSGMCSSHIGTWALVGKAFREGFYWPSIVADAHEVVWTCPNFQKHAHYNKFIADEVHLIPPLWPLA
jgi:hypothetical protein